MDGAAVIRQEMDDLGKVGHRPATADYELEYLARKFGVRARLAKAGRSHEDETREDAGGCFKVGAATGTRG